MKMLMVFAHACTYAHICTYNHTEIIYMEIVSMLGCRHWKIMKQLHMCIKWRFEIAFNRHKTNTIKLAKHMKYRNLHFVNECNFKIYNVIATLYFHSFKIHLQNWPLEILLGCLLFSYLLLYKRSITSFLITCYIFMLTCPIHIYF